jgi:hypothetical protein
MLKKSINLLSTVVPALVIATVGIYLIVWIIRLYTE